MLQQKEEWRREQRELELSVRQHDIQDWFLAASQDDTAPEGKTLLKFVGGLDISFSVDESGQSSSEGETAVAGLIVVELPSLTVVHQDFEPVNISVEYVPGFLGFREVPAFKTLLARLGAVKPQVLLVDGFGVLHPRRCGSASHLGVETGFPTIGVGKSLLAVDGLEEWVVVKEIREALALQRSKGPQACKAEPAKGGSPGKSELSAMTNDGNGKGSTGVLSDALRHASGRPPPGPKRFMWQHMDDPSVSTNLGPLGASSSGDLFASAASGNIADSGPFAEPRGRVISAAPGGRHGLADDDKGSANASETVLPKRLSTGTEGIMPMGEETDTDADTGNIRESEGVPHGKLSFFTKECKDGEKAVCQYLVSQVDGEHLGVAVAGIAGSNKPIYVSVGHHVSLDTALKIVLACCKHRIPEPIRAADLRSKEYIRSHKQSGDATA